MSDKVPTLATGTCPAESRAGGRGCGDWDRALLDDWVRRLGPDRMLGILVKLREQLGTLASLAANGSVDQNDDLLRRAHDAASTAGMIGFTDVTRCCRLLLEPGMCRRETRLRLAETLGRAIGQLDRYVDSFQAKAAA